MISGNGWAWARVREGGDSLSYQRGRDQSRGLVSGFTFWEVVVMEEDTDVEVGVDVGVWKTGIRDEGR